jgi:Origin recognition complex subunit 3 insertion domain
MYELFKKISPFQIRELYPLCLANDISTMADYKDCIKLIMFHSKSEILTKLDKCLNIIRSHQQAIVKTTELAFKLSKNLNDMEQRFENFNHLLTKAGLECATLEIETKAVNGILLTDKMNRHQMMDVS